MFTGLVEECGCIESLESFDGGTRLWLRSSICATGIKIGDSLAVNGACLTVISRQSIRKVSGESEQLLSFDVLDETMKRTAFQSFQPQTKVNLERALRAGDRLGGHFVSGHVDETGTISIIEKRGDYHYLEVTPQSTDSMKYLVEKGSVAIDGISLTVAGVSESSFHVWIIPHTLDVTNLNSLASGDPVNLEFDIIGKYVEKMTSAHISKIHPKSVD